MSSPQLSGGKRLASVAPIGDTPSRGPAAGVRTMSQTERSAFDKGTVKVGTTGTIWLDDVLTLTDAGGFGGIELESRSSLMGNIKTCLRNLHLLEAAFRIRDFLFSLRFIPRNLRYWLTPPPGGLALPPVSLVQLVTGSPDLFWFLSSGERASESVSISLERNGLNIGQLERILDFGCGCGRVTRHWAGLEACTVFGSDLNSRVIDWCRRQLTFARFDTNQLQPPLRYDSDTFDFVYALSVFTHLPEHLQEPWMAELRRVIRPNGHLMISTHGSRYLSDLTVEQRRRFEAGEIVVKNEEEAGSNRCGAYHPLAYVRDKLARGFALVEFVPEGAAGNPHQDLFLLRKL